MSHSANPEKTYSHQKSQIFYTKILFRLWKKDRILQSLYEKAPIMESLHKKECLMAEIFIKKETLPKLFYYELYKVIITIDISVEPTCASAYIRKIRQFVHR